MVYHGGWPSGHESTVVIIVLSTDDKDVPVEISSGGNELDKVEVPASKTVTGAVTCRVWWIKGTGGGSLLVWMPEVPKKKEPVS
jgi:hypothetical protein